MKIIIILLFFLTIFFSGLTAFHNENEKDPMEAQLTEQKIKIKLNASEIKIAIKVIEIIRATSHNFKFENPLQEAFTRADANHLTPYYWDYKPIIYFSRHHEAVIIPGEDKKPDLVVHIKTLNKLYSIIKLQEPV